MIIDLTHPLSNGVSVYPGTKLPSFVPGNTIDKDGFAELNITMTTHTGTHMDAPCHILPGTKSLDQFPIEQFIGRGLCLDGRGRKDLDKTLLQAYEAHLAEIEFLLFYTGWQEKWSTPQYFDPFPTLTAEAIQWLYAFDLKAVGFDYISADKMDDPDLPNHHLLLGKEILIIENLRNLDQLVGKSFEMNCLPLHIKDADGSPVRAFAKLG